MTIKVGSARHDEHGRYSGGAAGDQTGTEVSTQAMYTHSKGWYVFRPKTAANAKKIAERMKTACANSHIGYDQNNRLAIVTAGIDTTKDTECDCSSLVRTCVKEATGKDPGNFTTATEATMLAATGLFQTKFAYVSQSATPVYNGDVLVTKTKGHTVIVVSGNARSSKSSSSSSSSATYTVGKTYETKALCTVRKGAGASYAALSKSQLTADGKKHADSKGRLKQGTTVTCKATKKKSNGNVWMQIPSGWVLAYDKDGSPKKRVG